MHPGDGLCMWKDRPHNLVKFIFSLGVLKYVRRDKQIGVSSHYADTLWKTSFFQC